MENWTYYIEYLNKDKNHQIDRIDFDTDEAATIWGKENLDNFHPDMIKINF
jgi:hypothetical protein